MRAARRWPAATALLLAGCNLLAGIEDPRHEPTCGDGVIATGEACDDGNTRSDDGCAADCKIEPGFSCTGQPSACVPACGDGVPTAGEACDDGNTRSGDGCSNDCEIEPGFSCSGAPSRCVPLCGDGTLDAAEQCDDGNTASGDGCSKDCRIEPGFTCGGAPSGCAPVCGDGLIVKGEHCDDGNAVNGDGCSALCQVEHGYTCAGLPSACVTACGDGVVAADEDCDDGNIVGEDGCDPSCHIEHGYTCAGEPSVCLTTCGDDQIGPGEQCDDGNTKNGDGCDAACQVEPGFTCAGEPSACAPICGDGVVVAGEGCDDQNLESGDGCGPTCAVEAGYACSGEPSVCSGVCGDGLVVPGEQCDDGNTQPGDCCSPTCQIEPGCSFEVEPNDSQPLADARAADPAPVKLVDGGKIRGSISPVGDVDYFSFSLSAASSVVRAETFDGSGKDCSGIDTQLGIVALAPPSYADDDGGIGLCSALTVNLASGGYYLRVSPKVSSSTISAYLLELKVQGNAGSEVEPNDTVAAATPFNGVDSYMSGSHPAATDVDFYAVAVPPGGGSLRAEIIEGPGSDCALMRTELALYDAAAQQLLVVTGTGRGGCSRIDGTGGPGLALDPEAHALAAGKYYLRVRSAGTATPAQAAFAYRLSLVIR